MILKLKSKENEMDFLLLQINDSLFPIGGYNHSFGLESYIQLGNITNKDEALEYTKANLNTQILYTDLLAIKLIYEAKQNLDYILELESIILASSPAKELREGCLKLGVRFIKTICAMPLPANTFFESYIQQSKNPVHSSAYGVFCNAYGFDFDKALRAYLYAQASSIVTNCVKAIPLSQNDGQAILVLLHKEFELICQKLGDLNQEDFCNASLHNDIKAMQHQYLYSRLYMS